MEGALAHHADSLLAGLNHDLAETAMMLTADEYGTRMGITREACDEFAELSHTRARAAYRRSHLNGGDALRGMFAIDATDLSDRPVHLARDECVRKTSVDVLAKLPGITPHGLVSPGNASEISDSAAAVVLADRAEAERLNLPARYEVMSYGVVGVDPRVMGRGPAPAIQQALARAGLEQKDIGLFEINEAFAAQYLAVERLLGLPREKTNVNGSGIALGHPVGCTGARITVTLLHEMIRRDLKRGIATLCGMGGVATAILIERN